MMKSRVFFLLFSIFLSFSQEADASIMFSGDWQTGVGQIEFTEDLTFNITSTGFVSAVVFESIATPPDVDFSFVLPQGAQLLGHEINGTPGTSAIVNVVDNWIFGTSFGVDNGDGYITVADTNVVNGQTFTITAGTYNFTGSPGFNTLYNSSNFTGNVFLTNSAFQLVSDIVSAESSSSSAVPEPSSLLMGLVAAGGLCIVSSRRRRNS